MKSNTNNPACSGCLCDNCKNFNSCGCNPCHGCQQDEACDREFYEPYDKEV